MLYLIIIIFYSLLVFFLAPLIFLIKSLKNKKRNFLQGFKERFGFIKFKSKNSIMIHSVSFGEIIASESLVKKLINFYTDFDFVITTTTATGKNKLTEIYKNFKQVKISYFPFDSIFFIHILFKRINPKLLILVETEIWPALNFFFFKKKIPVFLINARLSKKSARNYYKFLFFTKKIIDKMEILAQSSFDRRRFLKLKAKNVKVLGNLKYDLNFTICKDEFLYFNNFFKNKIKFVASSIHKDEEVLVLKAFKKIKKFFDNAILIIIPRHPENFENTFNIAKSFDFKIVKYSQNQQSLVQNLDVYLVDCMGKSMLFYKLADICFVGGSLIKHGGHNIIEPARFKKPIISGKFFYNFQFIFKDFIKKNAIIIVEDYNKLAEEVIEILKNEELRCLLSNNSYEIFSKNNGICDKYFLEIIKKFNNGNTTKLESISK